MGPLGWLTSFDTLGTYPCWPVAVSIADSPLRILPIAGSVAEVPIPIAGSPAPTKIYDMKRGSQGNATVIEWPQAINFQNNTTARFKYFQHNSYGGAAQALQAAARYFDQRFRDRLIATPYGLGKTHRDEDGRLYHGRPKVRTFWQRPGLVGPIPHHRRPFQLWDEVTETMCSAQEFCRHHAATGKTDNHCVEFRCQGHTE